MIYLSVVVQCHCLSCSFKCWQFFVILVAHAWDIGCACAGGVYWLFLDLWHLKAWDLLFQLHCYAVICAKQPKLQEDSILLRQRAGVSKRLVRMRWREKETQRGQSRVYFQLNQRIWSILRVHPKKKRWNVVETICFFHCKRLFMYYCRTQNQMKTSKPNINYSQMISFCWFSYSFSHISLLIL